MTRQTSSLPFQIAAPEPVLRVDASQVPELMRLLQPVAAPSQTTLWTFDKKKAEEVMQLQLLQRALLLQSELLELIRMRILSRLAFDLQ